jgi:hypothetical protein
MSNGLYSQIAQGFNPGGGAVQAELMKQKMAENALARQVQQQQLGMQQRQLGMQEKKFGMQQEQMQQQAAERLRQGMLQGLVYAQNDPAKLQQVVNHYKAQGVQIPPQFDNITPDNVEELTRTAALMLMGPQEAAKRVAPEPAKPTTLMRELQAAGLEPGSPEYQQAILQAKTKPLATATIEAGEPGPDIKGERELRKEFAGETKDFVKVRDSFGRILSSAEEPTPAGDLSMIFNYMKMLDPGSVVRESEFEVAAKARPLIERMGLSWDAVKTAWEGKRLTPKQRQDFLNRARMLYSRQQAQFNRTKDRYGKLASSYGYAPERIVRDLSVIEDETAPVVEPQITGKAKSTDEILMELGVKQ